MDNSMDLKLLVLDFRYSVIAIYARVNDKLDNKEMK